MSVNSCGKSIASRENSMCKTSEVLNELGWTEIWGENPVDLDYKELGRKSLSYILFSKFI